MSVKDDCQSMIRSVLAYHFSENPEDNMDNKYLQEYITKLGRDAVFGMMTATIKRIDYIKYGVGIDSEGGSYNSIVWKEN